MLDYKILNIIKLLTIVYIELVSLHFCWIPVFDEK